MRFQFINLNETFADHLPLGHQGNQGKFIQLRHEERGEIIVFASRELCTFHAQIMSYFCQDQSPQWAFDLNPKQDNGDLYEDQVQIIGGGYLEILDDRKRLNLSGQSMAFGDYDGYDLDKKLVSTERFKGYRVFC